MLELGKTFIKTTVAEDESAVSTSYHLVGRTPRGWIVLQSNEDSEKFEIARAEDLLAETRGWEDYLS